MGFFNSQAKFLHFYHTSSKLDVIFNEEMSLMVYLNKSKNVTMKLPKEVSTRSNFDNNLLSL